MKKLKVVWMLLVLKFLRHILWMLDDLQEPYKRRSDSTKILCDECEKVKKQLKEE